MADFKRSYIFKNFQNIYPSMGKPTRYQDKEGATYHHSITILVPQDAEGKQIIQDFKAWITHHVNISERSASWTKTQKDAAIKGAFQISGFKNSIVKDGNEKEWPGAKGHYCIKLKGWSNKDLSAQAVPVFNESKQIVTGATQIDNLIYAGCYVAAAVTPYIVSKNGDKNVYVRLSQVMKLADGERIIRNEFEDIEVPDVQVSDNPFSEDEE